MKPVKNCFPKGGREIRIIEGVNVITEHSVYKFGNIKVKPRLQLIYTKTGREGRREGERGVIQSSNSSTQHSAVT
jgi:hypothetical protein